LLEAIRAGEVSRIVVYHVDRLYRQPRELEELIDLAERGRVEVVSVVSGEIDLRTSDGRFVARLLVSVAAKESDDKSRRIRRQKQQVREQGRWPGGRRAFGWQDGVKTDPGESSVGSLTARGPLTARV
jgi:DNA invertase Pin-like site-specific DNA recombinase